MSKQANRPREPVQPDLLLGWREWVALPELGITHLKAKIDTGARTSALHAYDIREFTEDGRPRVQFSVHPEQGRDDLCVTCTADLVDERSVRNSGGQAEHRRVIITHIELGGQRWPIEVTLTDRSDMKFRMLIGRAALRGRACVNPGASYLTGKRKRR